MHQGGARGVEIVATLDHPKSIVSTVLKEFEHRRSVEHPKSTGRLQKLSERSVRIINRALVQDRRQTLVDITNRSGVNMSALTVRKALHDVGFYNHIAQKKPFLFDIYRTRRFEFAREHRKWTIEDWKRVIWTNESTF
jgi:transposase